MTDRLTFPLPIKRQLRQEAGFGCCKCGIPIIEYHHIIPYTKDDPHYRVEDMMCLCPVHHHEADLNAMNIEEQRKWKSNPINIVNKRTLGFLKVNQTLVVLAIGNNNEFINNREIITIDDEKIIELKYNEEGTVSLSLKLFDEKNNLVLEIEENEWIIGDVDLWDIRCSFQYLQILQKKGKITFNIDARKDVITLIGSFFYNGLVLRLTKDKILSTLLNSTNTCFVGMTINFNSITKAISFVPTYNQAKIITDSKRSVRIKKGLWAFKELKKSFNSV